MTDFEPRWWLHGLPTQETEDWHDGEPPDRGFHDPQYKHLGYCHVDQHRRCEGFSFRGEKCRCTCHKGKA